jgi:hypothetical protein
VNPRERAAVRVRFPAAFDPTRAPIHTLDVLELPSSVEAVWARLIRAAQWSSWYANCRDLHFDPATPGPDLQLGTRFDWITFGVRVHTVVTEFEPLERLAWTGRALGGAGHHGWVLERLGPARCVVVTEEVQRGPLPWFGRAILRPRLHAWHRRWLRGLNAAP